MGRLMETADIVASLCITDAPAIIEVKIPQTGLMIKLYILNAGLTLWVL